MQIQNSWFLKVVETLLTAAAISGTMLFAIFLLAPEDLTMLRQLLAALNFAIFPLILLCIFGSVYWHIKEKKGNIKSDLIHSWMRGIIRYWLAYSISTYGFAKIVGSQFSNPYHRNDMVIGQLSGFQLTWIYFGHSYTLSAIIGCLQILGSVLLLFRKTQLMGTLVLLPVMINICLIDLFFDIPQQAFFLSILYTAALLFLLILRWDDLKRVLFNSSSKMHPIRLGALKPIAQVLTILLAFASIYLQNRRYPGNVLEGKWKVDEFMRNGVVITGPIWLDDQTVWNNIYVERFGKMMLCPNPYVYEYDRAQEADFKFDSIKTELRVVVHTGWSVKDTMLVRVGEYDEKRMVWNTVFKGNTLRLKLVRQP